MGDFEAEIMARGAMIRRCLVGMMVEIAGEIALMGGISREIWDRRG